MKYVITNGILYLSEKNKPVKRDGARLFKDKTLADKHFKNSVSKVLKNIGFKVEEIKDEPKNDSINNTKDSVNNTVNNVGSNDKINNTYSPIDIACLQGTINDLSDQLTTLKGNKDWLLDMESEVDKEISDIMHFIEFNNFSASDGYKLCKAIKDLRLRRRKIKNELELINIINVHTLNNVALGKTNKAITGLDNKKYAPRVLQDLFKHKDINSIIRFENRNETSCD